MTAIKNSVEQDLALREECDRLTIDIEHWLKDWGGLDDMAFLAQLPD